jgi:hypothetical protein
MIVSKLMRLIKADEKLLGVALYAKSRTAKRETYQLDRRDAERACVAADNAGKFGEVFHDH